VSRGLGPRFDASERCSGPGTRARARPRCSSSPRAAACSADAVSRDGQTAPARSALAPARGVQYVVTSDAIAIASSINVAGVGPRNAASAASYEASSDATFGGTASRSATVRRTGSPADARRRRSSAVVAGASSRAARDSVRLRRKRSRRAPRFSRVASGEQHDMRVRIKRQTPAQRWQGRAWQACRLACLLILGGT